MRQLALPAALVLLLSAASPAFAGAGIPKIASVKVGAYQANLYNSSPGARTGTNTFTVEIPNLEHGSLVTLQLTGPNGEIVQVPLKTLNVLGGAEEAHDEEAAHGTGEAHKTETPSTDHGHGDTDHAKAPAADAHADDEHADDEHGGDAHGSAGFDPAAFLVRGTAKLGAGGDWKALLEIRTLHGDKAAASFPLHAEPGGPNRAFVSVSGLVMGGSILYGIVQRNRQTGKGGKR